MTAIFNEARRRECKLARRAECRAGSTFGQTNRASGGIAPSATGARLNRSSPTRRSGVAMLTGPCRRTVWWLLSRSRQHDPERTKDEIEVEEEGPLIHVSEVELHPLVERDLVAVRAHLPETGEPRAHGEPAVLPLLIAQDFAGERRARADDAHVAAEDVQQLRQLVE